MTGLVRKATLLTAAGVLLASAAFAGVPSAANSTVPTGIAVVGHLSGTADPVGLFSVTVKDVAGNPMNGASVVVDFSGCADIKICAQAEQTAVSNPGALVNCAAKTIRLFTNGSGVVSFDILGGSRPGLGTSHANAGRVFANGVLIGSPSVAAYNLDGAGPINATDFGLFLTDFALDNTLARSNFKFSGVINATDLGKILTVFAAGKSATSCTTSCGP